MYWSRKLDGGSKEGVRSSFFQSEVQEIINDEIIRYVSSYSLYDPLYFVTFST